MYMVYKGKSHSNGWELGVPPFQEMPKWTTSMNYRKLPVTGSASWAKAPDQSQACVAVRKFLRWPRAVVLMAHSQSRTRSRARTHNDTVHVHLQYLPCLDCLDTNWSSNRTHVILYSISLCAFALLDICGSLKADLYIVHAHTGEHY